MKKLSVPTYEDYGYTNLKSKLSSQASEVQKLIIKLALTNFGMTTEEVTNIPNIVIHTIATAYHMTGGLEHNNGKRNWSDVDIYLDDDLYIVNQRSHNEVDCKRFVSKERFDQLKSFTDFIEPNGISLRLKRGFINHLNLLTEEL